MTSRELVYKTIEFQNTSGRVPRHLWYLPWAELYHRDALRKIISDFGWDITTAPCEYARPPKTEGDPYRIGSYTDEWGCRFRNIQNGVFGEVEEPIVSDERWNDAANVNIPTELLTFDADAVNRFCAERSQFVLAGFVARPFEQLQFMRGSQNLFVDLADPPPNMISFIKRVHDLYCAAHEKWAKTDVDALYVMDDWGSQTSLLIDPKMWRELFKPLYADYFAIAKTYGKKIFMHSDGNTLGIIPHLIEMGLDALNTQIFCIGLENLAPFKGKLTFWGEIDRQRLIPFGAPDEIDAAVDSVFDTLWDNGGCIAQCEFGAMGDPKNVRRIFERWERFAR